MRSLLSAHRGAAARRRPFVTAIAVAATLTGGVLVSVPATASAAGGAAGAATAAASAPAAAQAPGRYLSQKIDWAACFAPGTLPAELPTSFYRLECGDFGAPMDWRRPQLGIDIRVHVSRLKATSQPAKGALLTNPGGPGAPGMELPLLFLQPAHPRLLASQDIYGMDPRGTGGSTNTTCGPAPSSALDYRNRSADNLSLLIDTSKLTARYCDVAGGRLIDAVNTENTVHDIDLFRQLLHRDTINWVGYSGGTWMGAYYATYFPTHTGHFVLDSNTEFTAPWQASFNWQPLGFERRFREDFAGWAAKYDAILHLGRTKTTVRDFYETLRADLAADPVSLLGLATIDGVALDNTVTKAMYSKTQFNDLAHALAALRALSDSAGDPAAAASAREALRPVQSLLLAAARPRPHLGPVSTADASDATFLAVICNDTPWTGTRAGLIRDSAIQGRRYPLVGYSTITQPCAWWSRPQLTMPTPTGKAVPPVLMVQSEHDPATPLEGARRAAARFSGAHLLVVPGEGDHGVYASGNGCVDTLVERFLIEGSMPGPADSCAGTPIPAPTTDAAAAPRTASTLLGDDPVADAMQEHNPLLRLAALTTLLHPHR